MSKTKVRLAPKSTQKPWVVELYDPRNKNWVEVAEEDTEQAAQRNVLTSSHMTGLTYRFRLRTP